MQLDQNTWLIIGAVVVALLLVVIIANARRRPARTVSDALADDRDRLTTTGDASVEIRLSRLADLRSKGLVTEEEYDRQRGKILGEL